MADWICGSDGAVDRWGLQHRTCLRNVSKEVKIQHLESSTTASLQSSGCASFKWSPKKTSVQCLCSLENLIFDVIYDIVALLFRAYHSSA